MTMMTDIRERFRSTDQIPDPDLWPSVQTRLADRKDDPADLRVLSGRRGPDHVRRIVTIAAAFAIGVGSTLVAVRGFREVEPQDSGASDRSFGIFAPARGWIVYGRGSEVVAVDPNGGSDRQVVLFRTKGSGQIRGVTWSPDGRRLLILQRAGEGRWTALVVDADGRETNLGRVYGFGIQASWSPDGERIALAARQGIVVVPSHGGARSLLVSGAARGAGSPTWSPDGDRIAFLRGAGEGMTISEVDVATHEIREIFKLPSTPRWRDLYGLQWSPDGSQFLFGGCPPSDDGSWTCYAYVLDADGTGYRAVTLDHTSDWPSWSPTGGRIVYGGSNGPAIYVMDPAEGHGRLVSNDGSGPFSWNPG
jgi:Tol biopolymer transport system component